MKTTIGILAHVDAGKTTLSEQILFRTGVLRKAGRVDHADTLLDSDGIERARGITVYSGQASFSYGGNTFFLIDTPGHADFAPEMERALQVLDYAVLVVSSVEGIQAHTQVIWELLQNNHIPTFFFLNKSDRAGSDIPRVLAQIRSRFSSNAVLIEESISVSAEEIAMTDETLLEQYLEHGYDADRFLSSVRSLVLERKLFLCCSGSALNGSGVEDLLSLLNTVCVTRYDAQDRLSAYVYKVRYENGVRLCFLKILSGALYTKMQCGEEKIHEIRQYCGQKCVPLSQASAGELCAVTGLSLCSGDYLGERSGHFNAKMVPVLQYSIHCSDGCPTQTLLDALRMLSLESPELQIVYVPQTQKINVSVMGEVQLEVLSETLLQRFGLHCSFCEGEILYKETIVKPAYGCGHFEPLRHYAEVHLLARPLPRGSGVRFRSVCSGDVLRTNWQRLIETHVLEKTHVGALCGFPVTDIEFVLLTGRAHEKHTEGGDFRQSTYRAVRNALFHAESVILEPFYKFSITAPSESLGRILADFEKMSAEYDAPMVHPDSAVIEGRCPAAEMMGYKSVLTAFTKGQGMLSVCFDGYALCHDPQNVMEKHPYDRERDVENTADSVFCSHGAGFTVKWNDAPSKMHCTVDKSLLEGYTDLQL